jgi:hypothetical protein
VPYLVSLTGKNTQSSVLQLGNLGNQIRAGLFSSPTECLMLWTGVTAIIVVRVSILAARKLATGTEEFAGLRCGDCGCGFR